MVQSPDTKNALSVTIFEEHAPFTNNATAAEFVKLYNARAKEAKLPDTAVETQAAASYTAWQMLEAAVTATKSLDDKQIAAWLKKNRVDTIQGKLRFDRAHQLRRRPDAHQAGAERQVGRRVAEGIRAAGRHVADAVTGRIRR